MRGESSRVILTITNASRLFGANLVARDRFRPGGRVPVPLVRLRPGRVTDVSYPVPTSRRGVIQVGPLEISRRDPLGLVGVVRGYGGATLVWVRPRVHPIAAVPVGLSRSMDGRVDRVPHGSITFAALREYVIGDDLRHVHWRTSARVGELMVREHVDTSLPRRGPAGRRPGQRAHHRPRRRVHLRGGVRGRRVGAGRRVPRGRPCGDPVCAAARSAQGRSSRTGQVEVGPLLDLLAEATLGEGSVSAAVERLRVRRVGDTLLYLTGPPNEEDLGAVAGLRGAYPSIIAGVFGSVESGLVDDGRPVGRGRGGRGRLRRGLGRCAGMVSSWLRRLAVPLVVALADRAGRPLPRPSLQWTALGRAGRRRRARVGGGLGRAAAGTGLAGRAGVGGRAGRLRGVRRHRRRAGRWRVRRPAHVGAGRGPQRRAPAADRADPGRAAARHRARPGRAGLAGRLRGGRAGRPGPPARRSRWCRRRCSTSRRWSWSVPTPTWLVGNRSPSPRWPRSAWSPASRRPPARPRLPPPARGAWPAAVPERSALRVRSATGLFAGLVAVLAVVAVTAPLVAGAVGRRPPTRAGTCSRPAWTCSTRTR